MILTRWAISLSLLLTAPAAEPERQADLGKLRDFSTGTEEASRLAGCDGEERILVGYRFLDCPQSDGSADIHLLLAEKDYNFKSSYQSPDEYDNKDIEELFRTGPNDLSTHNIPATLDPSLTPINDSVVIAFDSDGQEIRPFGGNNLINHGYVFDFNRDGILERADSTNYRIKQAEGDSIESFKLSTVEREPHTLLEVIFNWHSRQADDTNDWTFSCFDEEGDGFVEIAFGPENASTDEERRRFIFRWDDQAQRYVTGKIPDQAHIRIVEPDETYASIAESGGLRYPLTEAGVDEEDPFNRDKDTRSKEQTPFVYQSLKGADDDELAAFFLGKRKRDPHFDGPEDTVPNQIPEGLWELPPKQAALALADANRSASHRTKWQIAIDDREGVKPPSSGWLVHNWSSSGCYSLSTHLIAVNFGVENPVLVVLEYNSIGVVGRNRWADQPAHAARYITLQPTEARFLADTIFWLDRVRAWSPASHDDDLYSGSSTADGFASTDLLPAGAPPYQIAASTVWATSSISRHWQGAYDRAIFINLTEQLLGRGLQSYLGNRWKVAPELEPHSLTTPTAQRLKERVDGNGRQQLEETLDAILKHGPPPQVIRELARTAGQESLIGLQPALDELLASLPARNEEDREFQELKHRFREDHFGARLQGERKDDADARKRLEDLRSKRRFDRANVLRATLTEATTKLTLAQNTASLIQAVVDESPQATWSLQQLRRTDIDAWADLVSEGFSDADLEERRRIFETLAAGHPTRARKLATRFSPKQKEALILELHQFHLEHAKELLEEDTPILLELVRDRTHDFSRRGTAMLFLADCSLSAAQHDELHSLLVKEINDPHSEGLWNTRSEAIRSLAKLPGTPEDIELISSLPSHGYDGFSAAIDAVMALGPEGTERTEALSAIIRARFQGNPERADGMMNDVFMTALALDLRELSEEIQSFATESPAVQDGGYSNSASTAFKGPKGHRYHIARETTSLWAEQDPVTLGRMWIFFVCAHPHEFDLQYADSLAARALRESAARAIKELPPHDREQTIDAALTLLPVASHLKEVTPWLRALE